MTLRDNKKHRFFAQDLQVGAVVLPDCEAHHAAHVLRLVVGSAVELLDGQGRSGQGKIVECKKNRITVNIQSVETLTTRTQPLIHLAFAVPKGKRLDWLLEKTTELGAASLRPIVFDRSVVRQTTLSAKQRNRWLLHCIAAAKQSGVNFLPDIRDPLKLDTFCSELGSSYSLRIFGDTLEPTPPLVEVLSQATRDMISEICILIGPEGNLTDSERGVLVDSGFSPVRIGSTVLRVETAVVALLAGVTALCDQW